MTTIGWFVVAPGDACVEGHFPDAPMVPGVVLLDEVAALLCRRWSGLLVAGIPAAKFTATVFPGQRVEVHCGEPVAGRVEFACTVAGTTVARGAIHCLAAAP